MPTRASVVNYHNTRGKGAQRLGSAAPSASEGTQEREALLGDGCNRWLGCRPLPLIDIVTECAVYGIGVGKQLVEVGVDDGDVRAFIAIPLGVLAPGAGTDEFRGVFGSEIFFVTAHKLGALGGSFAVQR